MSGRSTPATLALARAGIVHTVHAYDHDPRAAHYGTEAAERLGLDARRVHKTLVVAVDDGGGSRPRLAVGIVPVAAMLDLKAMAAALGAKRAVMADVKEAERVTGYVVGGISPVGQRKALPTVLDAGATAFPTVYVSAGRRGLEIELSPADLVRVTGAVTAPVATA
jgi:Cys-tRNA(Pro)/Cys-tRNA(Cys) deacylase